jgi:alkyl hydroperoxide reductase subunit AhpC
LKETLMPPLKPTLLGNLRRRRQGEGVSERALFVVDAEGVIRWSYVSPVGINPGADGILRALESLPKRAES